MSAYSRKDQQLLQESIDLQLLKESFPKMNLSQVEKRLPYMSISESAYVEQFSERVIEELFGGLANLAKSAGGGLSQGIKNVAQAGAQGAKNLAQGGLNKAKQVGSGAVAGAKQVGKNVSDIYSSAEDEAQAGKAIKQANAAAMQLVELVKAAQQKGLVSFSGDPMQLPLEDVINELILAQQGAQSISKSAQKQGVFGSAGKAFQKGFRS